MALPNRLFGVAVHGIVLVAVFFAADVAAVQDVWWAAFPRAFAVFMLLAAGVAHVNAVGFFLCFGGRHVWAHGLGFDQSGEKIVFLHFAVSGVMRRSWDGPADAAGVAALQARVAGGLHFKISRRKKSPPGGGLGWGGGRLLRQFLLQAGLFGK
ncbi:hypothetical protein N5D37_05335 [Comamonas aquatica]|uniref:hypothetical protein n=1 Tax=Comamonas aquatica TaxID=225991 RepID=UPI00244D3D8F|nr:hypothetical protein [Comamonas aquatica]MDH1765131.1 hypothetical protein [Comamonas aquatica]